MGERTYEKGQAWPVQGSQFMSQSIHGIHQNVLLQFGDTHYIFFKQLGQLSISYLHRHQHSN
jgi:hypothetical protein